MRIRSVVLAGALLAGSTLLGATPAHAVPTWNPSGTVHPGVQTITSGGQCTANFVFYDNNNDVYIGQAAHCASTGGPTDTNGCLTGSRPLGTTVTVNGATRPGKLVYSSWIAMQQPGANPTADQCAYNDFALVKLDPLDYGRVSQVIPFWGGPNALNTTGQFIAYDVFTYGNSSLRFGLTQLSPKQGLTTNSTIATDWHIEMYTATPGIPGDSGSAVLDKNGNALGVLVTLGVDGSNGVTSVNLALNYAKAHAPTTTPGIASLAIALAPGTFHKLV
jgi:hypothetical protein